MRNGIDRAGRYAALLLDLIQQEWDRDEEAVKSFYFTSRMLLSLYTYFRSTDEYRNQRKVFDWLRKVFIPEKYMERYERTLTEINEIEKNQDEEILKSSIYQIQSIHARYLEAEKDNDEETLVSQWEELENLKLRLEENQKLLDMLLEANGMSEKIFFMKLSMDGIPDIISKVK